MAILLILVVALVLIIFWVIGSPSCTAVAGLPSWSSSEEKVAPWMPSFPMRPPAMRILSPGRAALPRAPAKRSVTGRRGRTVFHYPPKTVLRRS